MPEGMGNSSLGDFLIRYNTSPTKARGISTHADAFKGKRGTSGWCSDRYQHQNVDKRNELKDRILSGA